MINIDSLTSFYPGDILFAQKICAVFTRKRPMGRDFYDIVFLMNDTKPSLEYLKDKNGISSLTEVKKKLLDKCSNLKSVIFQGIYTIPILTLNSSCRFPANIIK